jgi:hypothetical protein
MNIRPEIIEKIPEGIVEFSIILIIRVKAVIDRKANDEPKITLGGCLNLAAKAKVASCVLSPNSSKKIARKEIPTLSIIILIAIHIMFIT